MRVQMIAVTFIVKGGEVVIWSGYVAIELSEMVEKLGV